MRFFNPIEFMKLLCTMIAMDATNESSIWYRGYEQRLLCYRRLILTNPDSNPIKKIHLDTSTSKMTLHLPSSKSQATRLYPKDTTQIATSKKNPKKTTCSPESRAKTLRLNSFAKICSHLSTHLIFAHPARMPMHPDQDIPSGSSKDPLHTAQRFLEKQAMFSLAAIWY